HRLHHGGAPRGPRSARRSTTTAPGRRQGCSMITMMRRYRRALQVGLLIVIAAFVATSVFVFGSSSLRGDPGTSVATVNGEAISLERYQRRYQDFVNFYGTRLRERLTPEMAERLGLPQQVVEDLVQEALILQRAQAERLEVND